MGGNPHPETAAVAGPGTSDAPGAAEPANIRLLRRLVTGLALVMVIGMVLIVGLMLARLLQTPVLPLPETVALPEGARARAVTVTQDRYLVVTEAGLLLVYDRDSGSLMQSIELE